MCVERNCFYTLNLPPFTLVCERERNRIVLSYSQHQKSKFSYYAKRTSSTEEH